MEINKPKYGLKISKVEDILNRYELTYIKDKPYFLPLDAEPLIYQTGLVRQLGKDKKTYLK